MLLEVFDYEDELTPISVFKAMRERFGAPCAMLESAMQDDHNQFSLIAAVPVQAVVTKKDSFDQLKTAIAKSKSFPKSFPFSGGLVGYFNWEIFDEIEPTLSGQTSEYPHTLFYEFSHFFAFDHADKKIFAIQTTGDKSAFSATNASLIKAARNYRDPVVDLAALKNEDYADFSNFESEQDGAVFAEKVKTAKQKILDGEIFQMIISNGFKRDVKGLDGIDFYSILRAVEPTTHLVFYDFGEHGQVCGASPEILGSKRGQTVTYTPIAGTRYRGQTPEQDQTILAEMAADPKENAEHDMLLDLGRNDLGKVCETNSIKVVKVKYGRFFANVMHLVSDIEGQIKTDFDAVDFFKAIFPAGTLSGAPKLRAIKLIQKAESVPRNLYGGAMGYFSADGNMELCIAIRSFFLKDGVARFRTGAGVVQDSDPKKEWLEVHNKAKSLCKIFNYGLRNS